MNEKDAKIIKNVMNGEFKISDATDDIKDSLMSLAKEYLLNEKRRGLAFDQVANFHLSNGAYLWKINWNADPSEKGISQSLGIMVNYRYVLADIARNNLEYTTKGIINKGF